jgi:hypothetical protein
MYHQLLYKASVYLNTGKIWVRQREREQRPKGISNQQGTLRKTAIFTPSAPRIG